MEVLPMQQRGVSVINSGVLKRTPRDGIALFQLGDITASTID